MRHANVIIPDETSSLEVQKYAQGLCGEGDGA
jgi:hypothetical protein